jgi:HTH-type transcriptional regulator, sugar sensing transcriptional regulator
MDIIKEFKVLGLKPKLAAAYLAILKLQQANANQIAQEAKIERTNIYNVLEELGEMGLISKSLQGKRLSYIAESPVKFKQLLVKQESVLEQLLPVLEALQGNKQVRPKIKLYENKEGIRKVLSDSLNSQEKLRRDFAAVDTLVDFLGLRFINNQIKERVKRGIHVRSLRCVPAGKRVSEKDWFLKQGNKELLREVRYLDKSIQLNPTIFIYDHVVAIISSQKESFALVIESQDLSQAMKVLFDIAWATAKTS